MKLFCVIVTLVHTASGSWFFGTEQDPCVQLCRAYSAERRGAGFDLCDSQMSTCIRLPTREICTNLYWSRTEEGTDGYIFSHPRAGDLTREELARPVTCFDAFKDTSEDFNFLHEVVVEVGRLMDSRDDQSALYRTLDPFRYIDQLNQGNVRYSEFHDLFNGIREQRGLLPSLLTPLYS